MLSPAVMHRCADLGISLVLLDHNGRFKARLEGGVNGNILLRMAQHRAALDNRFSVNFSRRVIAGKIRNSRQVLLRGARDTNNDVDRENLSKNAQLLAYSIKKLQNSPDLDAVRGIEGDAAKIYFMTLPIIIKMKSREYFAMNGRSRRPPRDRFNALLSFLYSMVMNDCRSALEAVGLDPQLGFLHAVRPGRASLALDLMEEFRPPLADRLALTLINRGQITEKQFEEREGGSVFLNDYGRKTVVTAYQERKQEEVTHQLLEDRVPIGTIPIIQARIIARVIRGEIEDYLPFLVR